MIWHTHHNAEMAYRFWPAIAEVVLEKRCLHGGPTVNFESNEAQGVIGNVEEATQAMQPVASRKVPLPIANPKESGPLASKHKWFRRCRGLAL